MKPDDGELEIAAARGHAMTVQSVPQYATPNNANPYKVSQCWGACTGTGGNHSDGKPALEQGGNHSDGGPALEQGESQ